jgi:hypothetical protein
MRPYRKHVRTRRLALLGAVLAAAFPSTALADDPPACLTAKGLPPPDSQSIRGVQVGARAIIKGADGNPLRVASVSYCVTGGGDFSFALTGESDVVLVASTADGDAIGAINPTSPAQSARIAFPKMKKLVRTEKTTVYRVDARRQLLLGVAGGRVSFVGAADRLLLEYPHKLGYYLRRLQF